LQGVGKVLPLLSQVGGSREPSKQEAERRQEMYQLIETAEEALDEHHQSTFNWNWAY
jgi:hypothetical protein